jgi:hypothetical protein
MCGPGLRRSFVSHPIEGRKMTTPSDIAHHAARARTDELWQAAAAVRCAEQRSPRSTYRLNPWVARCVPPLLRPTTLHGHS